MGTKPLIVFHANAVIFYKTHIKWLIKIWIKIRILTKINPNLTK